MGSNIENTSTALGWLDKVLGVAEKYKFKTIFKTVLIIIIMAATIGFINNPTWIFEKFEEWKEKQHQEQMDLRAINNDKIQHLLEKSLYKIGADRVMLCELHNGNSSLGGLPFSKCSATFEVINDNIIPVAHQYQDQHLSLIPFATYLSRHGYFCGDIAELEQIDKGLYHRIIANGTTHFAACLIEGVDGALGFLFISFNSIDENHDCQLVREQIRHVSLETALLLELRRR